MSKTSEMIRENFKKGDDLRDAGLQTPSDIVRYDDVLYGTDEKWQVLDVYRPMEAEGKVLPVIVSVHGGGWVYGDKERYQYYCMSLAQQGFAVVNFTYRLAPEFKFPSQIEDINLVFQWITNHAKTYHMDICHVFGVGDSAGAHQLGLYAAACTNPQYAQKYDFSIPDKLQLKAIALNCGDYQVDINRGAEDMTAALMADYLVNGGTEEELEQICVTSHITQAFVPTFFMTCTGDFLMSQAAVLGAKLMEKKVPHEFHFYGDAQHELGHVFHCNMKLEEAKKCNTEECDFFKKFL